MNIFLRKIAVAAASSPAVEITQQGENLSIKTSTSVRTTNVSFTVGQSFNEITVDGRPCTVHNLHNVCTCIVAFAQGWHNSAELCTQATYGNNLCNSRVSLSDNTWIRSSFLHAERFVLDVVYIPLRTKT